MLALSQESGPSIIQVRGQNILPESISNVIINVLHQYDMEIRSGALIVVDESRTRIRILPLN